jgi:galactose-3-O-sulfotransferase
MVNDDGDEHTSDASRPATVIFLHIGKTGGSTLRKVLHRNFRRSDVVLVRSEKRFDTLRPRRENSLEDLARIPPERLRSARLIEGHMVFGAHEHVPGPSTYITLLRNPVRLAISQYRFVKRTPGHRLHGLVTSEGISLDDYIRRGISLEVDNSQTRAISGDTQTPFGEVREPMLERAKRNIEEHFAVVGLTERFDESLVLLGEVFGWTRLVYVPVKVAPRTNEDVVSHETIDLLEELNRFDLELYRFAAERLDRAIERHESFPKDLARFQRLNSLYRPWAKLTYALPKSALGRASAGR